MTVPVVDLFAGPGGLGEGFSRSNACDFRLAVSIEKDPMAWQTLRLRAAHRELMREVGAESLAWHEWDATIASTAWAETFDALRKADSREIRAACKAASEEAWLCELGPDNRNEVAAGIRARLAPFRRRNGTLPKNIVLIGGPPCQAYSIVGRSRNRGKSDYRPEWDHRHFLYLEYLNVIADLRPAVFVMENVKGMLTSRVLGRGMFTGIRLDLARPDLALGKDDGLAYTLVSLDRDTLMPTDPEPDDFIVRAEDHGVPQARHRVIICGIRNDVISKLSDVPHLETVRRPATVESAISDLPPLHPAISYRGKGMSLLDCFRLPIYAEALQELRGRGSAGRAVASAMEQAVRDLRFNGPVSSGAERQPSAPARSGRPDALMSWLGDRPSRVLANHECRAHMPEDLVRYLFVSAYGSQVGRSPKLGDFPLALLPEHDNVDRDNPAKSIFKDRFRVQVAGDCATTVTSHIGKDGHAFIHPDVRQCRSLTVREAARLQTFPDSYVFLGNRTSQYTQVGNAVPPLLALRIADSIAAVLTEAGLATGPVAMDAYA